MPPKVRPKNDLPFLTPKEGATLGALSWGASADADLSPEAKAKLQELDHVLQGRKLKGTLTSGRRKPDGTHSDHHHGNAIDFVAPGDMAALAAELRGMGYRAQFERKGQRNKNGSVASGDHIHISFRGGAPVSGLQRDAGLFAPPKAAKPGGGVERDAALFAPVKSASVPSLERDAGLFAPPKAAKPGGKGEVGDLMGGSPKTTGAPGRMRLDQAAAAAAGMPNTVDPRSAAAGFEFLKAGAARVGREMGRPVAAVTAAFNEMERRAQEARKAGKRKMVGPVDVDLAGAASDIAAGVKAGVEQFKKGEQPDVTVLRDWMGMLEPGQPGQPRQPKPGLNPTLYGAVTALEQLTPFAYDPNNLIMPGLGRVAGKVAGKLKGPATAAVERVPAVAARAKGAEIIENVIEPSFRHKENVQGAVRQANLQTKAARKESGAIDAAVKESGGNPTYDLAAEYAIADTGRVPGRVTLPSPQVAQGMASKARDWGLEPAKVQEVGEALAAEANDLFNTLNATGRSPLKKGISKKQWLEKFFEVGEDGVPQGLHMIRSERMAQLFKDIAPHASPTARPGWVQVPTKMLVGEGGTIYPQYSRLAGAYLPKEAFKRLQQIVETAPSGIAEKVWQPAVRAAKSSYLYQPWTPIKNLVQNAAGVDVLMQKTGGSLMDVLPHAKSTMTELWQFGTTGKLSPALKEFSDFDPSFLQALENVKVADGTAGRFVRVGGRAIELPGVEKVVSAINPGSSEHVFLKANGLVDQLGKLSAFKALRAKGIPAEEAVKRVNRHVISYGNLPAEVGSLVATLDRNGIVTFANVPAQLAMMAAHTAVTRPDLLARPGQLQTRMLKAFGAQERYQNEVPEDKKSPFVVPNPLNPETFVDYGALSPFQTPMAMAKGVAGLATGDVDLGELGEGFMKGTIAGPWYQVLKDVVNGPLKGAPVEDQIAAVRQRLKDTYFPMGRAAGQFAAAGENRSASRDPFAMPETTGEVLSSKLGVRPVRTQTEVQKKVTGAPAVAARAKVAAKTFMKEWEAAGGDENPYRAPLAEMPFEKAKRELAASTRYLRGVMAGNETTEDQIRRAAQRHRALIERVTAGARDGR